jgi:hypothetical protein
MSNSISQAAPMSAPRPAAAIRVRSAGLIAAAAAGTALALAVPGPAVAHAGVTASDARALAKKVTITLTSEAESKTAGLATVQVVLPEGISPGAVSLKKAPQGWKLAHAQGGYVLSGKALPTGTDAVHSIVVEQLPDARSLVFRVVETYADGQEARWIEPPSGGKKSANPAPVLALKAKEAGATPDPAAPARSETAKTSKVSAEATPGAPDPVAKGEEGEHRAESMTEGGSSNLAVIIEVIAAVVVLGLGLLWIRKRRSRNSS